MNTEASPIGTDKKPIIGTIIKFAKGPIKQRVLKLYNIIGSVPIVAKTDTKKNIRILFLFFTPIF